jgi:UDP-glucose 4-epimerase
LKINKEKILVVGGAGYIGSHMVKLLQASGYEPLVLDDLSGGFADACGTAPLVVGSIANAGLLEDLLCKHAFAAVMHFASFIQVGESVAEPAKYYANNLAATLTLLEAMRQAGIGAFIFSSTAAVYGDPVHVPIREDHPKQPINPYGRSKWMVEQILEDFEQAYGLRSICLRYFNAAGADPEGMLGERHDPETHLIPLVLQAATGRRAEIKVFGSNYPTPDGTCIRDYIHVQDLCSAHLLALERLLSGGPSGQFNLGNGLGFSVNQVINTAQAVTGRTIPVSYAEQRAGDPPQLVADAQLAKQELGWRPQFADLATIVRDAWQWELQYPWDRC